MIDFAALMNYAFESRLYLSDIHGIEHWHQVEYNGMLLAKKTGADFDVVRLFAIFHDCLDLGRVGIPLNPSKMATEWGAKIAQKSLASGYSVFHMREWIRSLVL